MTEAFYKRREKYRLEQASQIKSDCEKEYPDCSKCGFRKQIGNRIRTCKFGTKPIDWDI